jgi:hypothetical protein
MSEPSQFRHYQIVQDADGNNVELARNADQVAVLAFDTQRLEFVHCHVLLQPLTDRKSYDQQCKMIQKAGHPALARLVDFGEDEGNPFYITSNVDGEPLRTYLMRLTDLPCWLAVMLACRAMESAVAVSERGDFLSESPLDAFRVVQTGPQTVQVLVADFRVLDAGSASKKRALKTGFDKQAKFLKSFLVEQSGGGVVLADHPVPAVDFMELLSACLGMAGPGVIDGMRELAEELLKLAPERLSGEIPTAQKPRALLAPLLASYQEVARGLVNLVRIQSQRLDMANPYSMRGTLTKAGRPVLIEQVPSARVSCERVLETAHEALKATKNREFSALVKLCLVNESEGINCMAEEVVEGISLADVLKERGSFDVQETYLVLAGLDSALSQVDASSLPVSKLRLDDIFLLTGFSREDPRSARLLVTKLNEWPAFNIMVRAHPTLASMAGRGTDPAVLLAPVSKSPKSNWHGGWLAALGKLLIGLESPVGILAKPAASSREMETLTRLLEDEIAKVPDARASTRGDFLARYARVMQHHDLVKPLAGAKPAEEPVVRSRTVPVTRSPESPPARVAREVVVPLTSGSVAGAGEATSIGFAELLFRSGAEDVSTSGMPDWNRSAEDAPPTLPEHLIPDENVPMWLKAAVFVGGSMVVGAVLAHLSGQALWLRKMTAEPKAPAPVTSVEGPRAAPASSVTNLPEVPKAIPVDLLRLPADSQEPGVSLSLPAGAGGLREELTREPSK